MLFLKKLTGFTKSDRERGRIHGNYNNIKKIKTN